MLDSKLSSKYIRKSNMMPNNSYLVNSAVHHPINANNASCLWNNFKCLLVASTDHIENLYSRLCPPFLFFSTHFLKFY